MENIQSFFEKQVNLNPNKVAIYHGEKQIIYTDLNKISNKIANLIKGQKIEREEVVALLLKRSPETFYSVLGVLKSGCAYLPINWSLPKKRILEMINDSKCRILIAGKDFMALAEELIFESNYLKTIICVDSYDEKSLPIAIDKERISEFWDYIAESGSDSIESSGWVDSYTGNPFSIEEMKEMVNNVVLKLDSHLNQNSNVLEIGCGTGMIAEKIAPKVKKYTGIDVSKLATDRAIDRLKKLELNNVEVFAEDFLETNKFKENSFNIIVINSVAQFYPNLVYLNQILSKCILLLKNGGVIFIGDVRDASLKTEYYRSLFKDIRDQDLLEKNINMKLVNESELFIYRDYFADFAQRNQFTGDLKISNKIGVIDNELKKYRYDALIIIEKNHSIIKSSSAKNRFFLSDINKFSDQDLKTDIKSSNLAYVIYTSGSTGKPKGVMIEHGSVINRIEWMQEEYSLNDADKILHKTPYSFDVSVWELLWWAMFGASVVLIEDGQEKDPETIIEAINKYSITTIHFVPPLLSVFLEYVENNGLIERIGSLRRVFASGEALNKDTVLRFNSLIYKKFGTKLHNLYGPTEATVDVSYFDCSVINTESKYVPIGKPIKNIKLYILDKELHKLKIGEEGELYISGVGVARGYINNEKLTKEKFLDDPFEIGMEMYKTGDLAKCLPDGNICYLDRIDNQVKIRGYRIELGEIEETILTFPGVSQAVVLAIGDNSIDKKLVAFFKSSKEIKIDLIKSLISKSLPEYCIPSSFIRIEKMPIGSHGKIDRKFLHDKYQENSQINYQNSEGKSLAEKISNIFSDVLKISEVDVNSNFFDLGGNSLQVINVLSIFGSTLNIRISIRDFFRNPTPNKLAELIEGNPLSSNLEGTLTKVGIEKPYYKASHNQKRLWFLNKLHPDSTSYNIVQATSINGLVDIPALKNAIKLLINKHEILRTNFDFIDGEVVQIIKKKNIKELEFVDIKGNAKSLDAIIHKTYKRRFDLHKDNLAQFKLVKISNKRFLFLLSMHHIVCDGRSMEIINKEISDLYVGFKSKDKSMSTNTDIDYKDYSEWENSKSYSNIINKQESYWINYLGGNIAPTNLPIDKSKDHREQVIDYKKIVVGKNVYKDITKFYKKYNSTSFNLFLSLFFVFLYKITGDREVIVGTPVYNRRFSEINNSLGYFANTLPIKAAIDDSVRFSDFLSIIGNDLLNCLDNQEYPFEMMVEKINPERVANSSVLFQTMIVHYKKDRNLLMLDGSKTKIYDFTNPSGDFDLVFSIIEDKDNFEIGLKYNKNIFHEDSAERMIRNLETLMLDSIKHENEPISKLKIIHPKEEIKIEKFNNTYFRPSKFHYLFDYLEDSVKKYPDKIAVEDPWKYVTYKNLSEDSNRFANYLIKLGIKKGDFVPFIMERSVDVPMVIYGILKTGAAYVPLDPEYPIEKLKDILRDINPKLLITHNLVSSFVLESLNSLRIINIDNDRELINKESSNFSQDGKLSFDALAYVIYTSGSTGKPKGVMCMHKGAINTVEFMAKTYKLTSRTKMLHTTSFVFDPSVSTMNVAIKVGATLTMLTKQELKDPEKIRKVLLEKNITFSRFDSNILNYLNLEGTKLKGVNTGGEKISSNLPIKISKFTKFFYTYGPTEISIFCTLWKGTIYAGEQVPIGKPIDNMEMHILDKNMMPVSIGVKGEIYISGVGVASGYFNDKEKTERVFLQNPFNIKEKIYKTGDFGKWLNSGDIVFLGRVDSQVKVRGYRIEIGEIENAMFKIPEIRECFIDISDNNGDKEIVAYYSANKSLSREAIVHSLLISLPKYMIPDNFIYLEAMPKKINSKIDADALRSLYEAMLENVKVDNLKNSKTEANVLEVWKKVLKRDGFNKKSDFFKNGGNSLKVLQVIYYLGVDHDIVVNAEELYTYTSPEDISKYIDSRRENNKSRVTLERKNNLRKSIKVKKDNKETKILLTGGAGFLGAYLTRSLLNSNYERIYVLVRSNNDEEARKELFDNLDFYFKNIDKEKIIPVAGDLSKENLGLSEKVYNKIIDDIGAILHSAANVSHVGNLEDFERDNVRATKNIITFANKKEGVKIYHISTISVSGDNILGKKKFLFTENDFSINQNFNNFYEKTKYESEKIIREFFSSGGKGAIFRLGNITSDSKTGICQRNVEKNGFLNFIRAIIQIGVPDNVNPEFGISPVDICAKSIVYLISHYELNDEVLHIFNEKSIKTKRMINMLNRLGYPINYYNHKKDLPDNSEEYLPYIVNYVSNPAKTKFKYDNRKTEKLLNGSSVNWPIIDEKIIGGMISYLKTIKFI